MRLIVPKPITLVSSNVDEDTRPVWDSSATYNKDDEVIVKNIGKNGITKAYKSLSDNNVGNYPPEKPDMWEDLGATNRWKMFDEIVGTQTVNSDSIDVTITSSKITHVALFETEATSVLIEVYDDTDTLLAQYTPTLRLDSSLSWSDYFFGDVFFRTAFVRQIPYLLGGAKIRVLLEGSTVKCGMLLVGYGYYIGETKWSPHLGINDYSRKEIDDWGRAFLKQGYYAKTAEIDVEIRSASVDKVQRLLASVRATPCIWQMNNDTTAYDALVVYGFYKDFAVILENVVLSSCSLTIEGLI